MSYQRDVNDGWKYGPQVAVLVVAIVAILAGGFFGIRKVLLPAEEQLRREVYEESKSYRDGTVRDLDNLRLQWLAADSTHRAAIAATARHRVADFPREDLPERVREWVDSIS